jgi:transcriptional regulator with XRE-family HTH domain
MFLAVTGGCCDDVGMTASTGHPAPRLQRLAALVTQRRAALGWSQEKAAEAAGIAVMTYRRMEEARRVQAPSYAKLEVAFGFRAGACLAVLGGASTVALADGGEMSEVEFAVVPPEMIEEKARQAITNAMVAGTDLTPERIKRINDAAIQAMRDAGILPPADQD